MKPKEAGARSRPHGTLPLLALSGYLGLLGVLTLSPAPVASEIPPFLCLLCSDRAVADAVANILLFIPLGVLLNVNGLGIRGALLAALALSGGIEAAQILVPGRFPDLSDVLTNGGGGVLGVILGRRPDRWILPSSPWRPRLFAGMLVLATALPFASGVLLGPVVPTGRLWGQWAPRMPHLEPWQGRVLAVELGGSPLPHAVPLTTEQRVSLREGGRLRVVGEAGVPPTGLAPVLRIVDDVGTEARLLAFRGEDLVWLVRNRAQRLRLDSPEVRWEGVLAGVAPGAALDVGVEQDRSGICLRTGGDRVCGLEHDAGRGWAFLLSARWLPAGTHGLLDHLWIGGILFLVGFWTLPARAGAAWAGLLLPLVALAVSGGMPSLQAATPTLSIAGALGWFLGWRIGASPRLARWPGAGLRAGRA